MWRMVSGVTVTVRRTRWSVGLCLMGRFCWLTVRFHEVPARIRPLFLCYRLCILPRLSRWVGARRFRMVWVRNSLVSVPSGGVMNPSPRIRTVKPPEDFRIFRIFYKIMLCLLFVPLT